MGPFGKSRSRKECSHDIKRNGCDSIVTHRVARRHEHSEELTCGPAASEMKRSLPEKLAAVLK